MATRVHRGLLDWQAYEFWALERQPDRRARHRGCFGGRGNDLAAPDRSGRQPRDDGRGRHARRPHAAPPGFGQCDLRCLEEPVRLPLIGVRMPRALASLVGVLVLSIGVSAQKPAPVKGPLATAVALRCTFSSFVATEWKDGTPTSVTNPQDFTFQI